MKIVTKKSLIPLFLSFFILSSIYAIFAQQTCLNTKTSCGIPQNQTCPNLYTLDGCYDGYYRNYYCSDNVPQYSQICTSYCCGNITGTCLSGTICSANPPIIPDTTAPIVTASGPSGTLTSNSTTIWAVTDETSACKYDSSSKSYETMANTMSNATGNNHTASLSGLPNAQYNFYVRCSDNSGNMMTTDAVISFTVNVIEIIPCTDHSQCSQQCSSLCPVGVYGCCYGCELGQCVSGECQCVDATSYCSQTPPYQVGSACGQTTTTTSSTTTTTTPTTTTTTTSSTTTTTTTSPPQPPLPTADIFVSKPMQLTNDTHYDRNPSVFKANDGKYWLFFVRSQDSDSNYGSSCLGKGCDASSCNCDAASYDVYYKTSTDNGTTWSTEIKLTNCSVGKRGMDAFQDSSGKIWVFVSDPGPNNKIEYCYSTDNGATWNGSIDTGLTGSHVDALQLNNSYSTNGWIYLVYESSGVKGAWSSDNGATWSSGTIDGTAGMGIPKAMDVDNKFQVVYINWALPGDPGNLYYKTYNWTTSSWNPTQTIQSRSPLIGADPVIYKNGSTYGIFWAPWNSGTNSQWIESLTSSDSGATWSSGTYVTNGGYGSTYWWDMWPDALVDGSNVYLFYGSEKGSRIDGNIFMYKVDWNLTKDHFEAIQPAVDAASQGNTILIKDGTYDEQVVIDKSLTLIGEGNTPIIKPSSASVLTTVLDGNYWGGGTKQIAGIVVANVADGSNVTLENVIIDGDAVTSLPTGADFVAGIFYRETGGLIDSVTVANVTVGSTGTSVRGYGIYMSAATNTVSVEVKDSTIKNYDKNGIESSGDKLTLSIHNNTIIGRGPLPSGDEVQNGILIADGAVGTVDNNILINMSYIPETWWSAAVMFYEGFGSATNNQIKNCQIGVIYQDGNGTASYNSISGTESKVGVHAQYTKAGAWAVTFTNNVVNDSDTNAIGVQSYDAGASIIAIINNNQLNGGPSDGIYIGDVPPWPAGSITVTITNNLISNWQHGINLVSSVANAIIKGNTIQNNVGIDSGIHVEAAVDATKVNATLNNIIGNSGYGIFNGGTNILNAKYNWWGTSTGPYHPTLNPSGTGNAVSDYVDFDPWLLAPAVNDTTPPSILSIILNPSINNTYVKAGKISFTINFNKVMNTSVPLNITFGQYYPYLQNLVVGNWLNGITWKGYYLVMGTEQIIDNGDPNYLDTGDWTLYSGKGYDNDFRYMSAGSGSKNATWRPVIGTDGNYKVYVSWTTYSNRATNAKYTVYYNGGNQTFVVNQTLLANGTVGGTNEWSGWYYLGTFNFKTNSTNLVVLTDDANNYVIADAVKFESSTSLPGDGPYRLRIADGKDLINNTMTTDTSFTFYVDTQNPVVNNPRAQNISYLQNQTITVQAYDWGSGIANVVVRVNGTNYTMQLAYNDYVLGGTGNLSTLVLTPIGTYYAIIPNTSLSVGMYNYRFFVTDRSGNVNDTVLGSFFVNGTATKTGGKVAYLCRNDPVTSTAYNNQTCDYGIENQTIRWLRSQGWDVEVRRYDVWTASQLSGEDLIVCSDEDYACRPTADVITAHNSGKGFVEIPTYPLANAGYSFGYLNNQYGYTYSGETDLFVTTADTITAGYIGNVTIYDTSDKGIGVIFDYSLKPSTIKIADIGESYAGYKSSLFKVEKNGTQGRYAWVGWFYGWSYSYTSPYWSYYYFYGWTPQDLNSKGTELLKKTLNWAQCGNAMGCKI